MNFTDSQIEAITTNEPEELVLAGAGSGKTRVLVERVKYLMESGASTDEMMVLTFTNRAADEMVGRLAADLGGGDQLAIELRRMYIGTFHSVSLRILQQHGDRIGYRTTGSNRLTVISPLEAELFLKWVCRRLGLLCGTTWKHGLSFSRVQQRIDDYYTGTIREERNEMAGSSLQLVLIEYHSQLRSCNCLDFGQMLRETKRLLTTCPDIHRLLVSQIKHVLVDEVQDTDQTQYDLHKFFSPPATFFAVGDFRQSIYSWRGARPDLMAAEHPHAYTVDLRECFRCGDSIVEAANSLISHDLTNPSAPMIGATGQAGRVEFFEGDDDQLSSFIDGAGVRHGLGNVAVLSRIHSSLDRIEPFLRSRSIPYRRIDSRAKGLFGSPAFSELHACLKLACNPNDLVSMMVLNEDLFVGSHSLEGCIAEAIREEQAPFFCYLNKTEGTATLASYIAQFGPQSSLGIAVRVLYKMLSKQTRTLRMAAHYWLKRCRRLSIELALDWFAAQRWEKGDDFERGNHVTLATIHAVKGLEWKAVMLLDFAEGRLPSKRAMKSEDVSEERRVAYVGMTRAADRLIVHCYPEAEPSRFISEAGIAVSPGAEGGIGEASAADEPTTLRNFF
jgi:superfamily I DNA/RNA helicase